ncbi:MAG: hypothetical protein ACKV22_26835 [Bryobacteraceae bacterium]
MPIRFLILVCVMGALAAPTEAQEARTLTWSELSEYVQPDWTVRLVLPDANKVQGRGATFTPEALTLRIVKTSNPTLYPKASMKIPREQVKTIDVRENCSRGRWIGVLVPVAAGVAVGAGIGSSGDFLAAQAGGALGVGIAVVGGVAGYIVGRAIDRRFHRVAVKP